MQRIWLLSLAAVLSFALFLCLFPLFLLFKKSQIVFSMPDSATATLLLTLLVSLTLWKTASTRRRRRFQKSGKRAKPRDAESSFYAETLDQFVKKLDFDRKTADKRAETAEELSRRVVEGLPSGLIVFDAGGLVNLANPQIYNLFAIEKKIEGVSFEKVFENLPILQTYIREVLTNGKTFRSQTITFLNDKNVRRQLGVTAAPLESSQDYQFGALCLLTDITEINELREQIAVKHNLASLGEMAAGITHEFKNSLAAIQSYAQFWQSVESDENSESAARMLLSEVNNLSQTVAAFLNFAKPQKLSLSDANSKDLVEESIADLQPSIANENEKNEKIVISVEGDFYTIKCDEILLVRVFINLLINAAESFAELQTKKEIKIIGEKTLDSNNKNWQTIKFQDSGAGIKEEHLPFLFVPFFSTKTTGHGIGLALANRIVNEHGGRLTAENNLHGGTTFTCKLPLSDETN
jgi:signal transduction histidine kinase